MRPTAVGQRVCYIGLNSAERRGKHGVVTKYEPSPDGHPHFLIHVRMDDTGIEWSDFVGNYEIIEP